MHNVAKKSNNIQGLYLGVLPAGRGRVILPICSALVSPHLECCVQLWAPQHMGMLQEIQCRNTKMIEGLQYLSYNESRIGGKAWKREGSGGSYQNV